MSITIRTKEGQEIDLDSVRERARYILANEISYSMGQCTSVKRELGLADALEAALSVPVRGGMKRPIEMAASSEYLEAWNACRAEQHRRAGVIEEKT